MQGFGDIIKQTRKNKKLTQGELGKIVGVTMKIPLSFEHIQTKRTAH